MKKRKKSSESIPAFVQEINQKFDDVIQRFSHLDKNVTHVMMKTEQRLDSIERRMATKEDIKGFSTKDDLKGFATKDDISRIALVLDQHGRQLEQLQETKANKVDVDRLVDKIDYAMKSISVFDQEERVQSLHLTEAKRQIDDHEKRLIVLETRLA